MVERSRRGKQKHRQKSGLLGSHNRSWIWGRNLVCETLAAGRWPIVELHLADSLTAEQISTARLLATKFGAKIVIASRESLTKLGQTSEHQGYLAKMGPFPYAAVDEFLAAAPSKPLYLVLDAIQDPFNFGAMLRSAAAFGCHGVLIGVDHQTPVNSQVARSSAGVVNQIPIVQVENLADLADVLRDRKVKLVGASEKGKGSLANFRFPDATAIVIGNEGTGIRPALLERCSYLVRIPMQPSVNSLNAATAAALFCYEAQRQRSEKE